VFLLSTRLTWNLEAITKLVLTSHFNEDDLSRAEVRANVSSMPALSRLVLTVDPRLDAKVVARLYQLARSKVIRGRDRPLSDKSLKLAVFLAMHRLPATWKELRKVWDTQYPEWAYADKDDAEARLFARDARAAYRRVTGRSWRSFQTRKGQYPGLRNVGILRVSSEETSSIGGWPGLDMAQGVEPYLDSMAEREWGADEGTP
jgi:hypothetical protein